MGASALLLLGAALPALAQERAMKPSSSAKALVVYFSRSGNPRVIAGTIQRERGTDIFEIKAATPYPEDYEATVERARIERDKGIEPPLAQRVGNLDQYDTIYLGFPIWGETAPPVIRSFLRSHDLKGKTIHPFITHGGYGPGTSLSVLASHAPGAKIVQAFVLEADQEKRTISKVDSWLEETAAN
ncbi:MULTISPECIES: flavodoxin [unclassified Mesorhizobium]|uniref:flavodoxin n=1 Tax=unclassified Mesorhizobium TaxID=325217 RepID=UPI00112B4762|nr:MULTISPECIES: flavodoxin [unclassified Mesorhizobium]MBZ9700541.1 flavodoxin [Mesorhizobium sp. CO1-1-3]MBZ9946477.1 flavodoxin [Mesorhizobium sp. BR1-1-11]TPI96532.1 flavodoxin [Mesorhizobium sp. B2-8-1]